MMEKTYDHYYYHTQQPPQSLQTCTSRTRNPHKKHQSDFAAAKHSFYFWDRRQGFGRDWAGESFESRMA